MKNKKRTIVLLLSVILLCVIGFYYTKSLNTTNITQTQGNTMLQAGEKALEGERELIKKAAEALEQGNQSVTNSAVGQKIGSTNTLEKDLAGEQKVEATVAQSTPATSQQTSDEVSKPVSQAQQSAPVQTQRQTQAVQTTQATTTQAPRNNNGGPNIAGQGEGSEYPQWVYERAIALGYCEPAVSRQAVIDAGGKFSQYEWTSYGYYKLKINGLQFGEKLKLIDAGKL